MMFWFAALLAPAERLAFTDAVVVKTYPASVGCGILKLWGAVDFAHDGTTDRVYVLCAMASDLPRTGAHCSVKFHRQTIDAVAADQRQTPFEGYAADAMTCDPPIAG
jgi:hypothetical protein